jgi:uncharacterized membrane protein YoaK (UPF0700 family)
LLELTVLIIVAFLPTGFSSTPIVLAISFVASVQSSIFTKLDKWSYNSVIATGNLRRATESFFRGVSRHRDAGDLEQSKKFGAVTLSFLGGAGLGAVATNLVGNAATTGAAIYWSSRFSCAWAPAGTKGRLTLRCEFTTGRRFMHSRD